MRTGAKLRRYSDQMRGGSQQQSPSEVVAILSDLALSPAEAYAIRRILRRPLLQRPMPGSRLRKSIFALCASGAIRNVHQRESSGHFASYKGRLNAVTQFRCPPLDREQWSRQPGPRKDLYLRS